MQICIPLLSQSKNFLQLDIGGSLPFFRKRSRKRSINGCILRRVYYISPKISLYIRREQDNVALFKGSLVLLWMRILHHIRQQYQMGAYLQTESSYASSSCITTKSEVFTHSLPETTPITFSYAAGYEIEFALSNAETMIVPF